MEKSAEEESVASQAYEVLNFIIGDVHAALFLHQYVKEQRASLGIAGQQETLFASLERNKYRILASALYRFSCLYRDKLKDLELNEKIKSLTEKFNQKLHGCEVNNFRHLFEHELKKSTKKPHKPHEVESYFLKLRELVSPDFSIGVLKIVNKIQSIRDAIAVQFPDCGTGVDDWKAYDGEYPELMGHNMATFSSAQINPIYS